MIEQVHKYLNPNPKNHAPNLNILLAYQQLQDIKNHSSNIQSKHFLVSLDLENNECISNILNLITPFHVRNLSDEIKLLKNILEILKHSNEQWWLDFPKEELQQKISRFLEITLWIDDQPSPKKEALFIYYQKHLKLTQSLKTYEQAYKELQSLAQKSENNIWINARLPSYHDDFFEEIINDIYDPIKSDTPQHMMTHLQKLQNLDTDKLDYLNKQKVLSRENLSTIQKILETILCIQDTHMRNIYFSYVQTHCDLLSSMTDLEDFHIFLQNKLIEQDLDDISFPTEPSDLKNNLIKLQGITDYSCDIPLLDTISTRLTFLTKIHQLMDVAHQIKEKPLGYFGYFMYFIYFLFSLFTYQTPNYQALVIHQQLQNVFKLYNKYGLSDEISKSLSNLETHPIFRKN